MALRPVDQRAGPRVAANDLRILLNGGERYVRGNVSLGGVGFETDECLPLAVGDKLRVKLQTNDDNDTLELEAKVRHVHVPDRGERFYVGAAFDGADSLVLDPLFRYVEESYLVQRGVSPRPPAARASPDRG